MRDSTSCSILKQFSRIFRLGWRSPLLQVQGEFFIYVHQWPCPPPFCLWFLPLVHSCIHAVDICSVSFVCIPDNASVGPAVPAVASAGGDVDAWLLGFDAWMLMLGCLDIDAWLSLRGATTTDVGRPLSRIDLALFISALRRCLRRPFCLCTQYYIVKFNRDDFHASGLGTARRLGDVPWTQPWCQSRELAHQIAASLQWFVVCMIGGDTGGDHTGSLVTETIDRWRQ